MIIYDGLAARIAASHARDIATAPGLRPAITPMTQRVTPPPRRPSAPRTPPFEYVAPMRSVRRHYISLLFVAQFHVSFACRDDKCRALLVFKSI